MKKYLLTFFLVLLTVFAQAQEPKPTYNASKFGIRSDGVTMNTRSIQFAIDWIAEQGGGTLRFWVGRYLTGSMPPTTMASSWPKASRIFALSASITAAVSSRDKDASWATTAPIWYTKA